MSTDAARGREFAARCQIDAAYTELSHLLADSRVNAVYISTTNELHHPQVLAAAAAGKHVLVEKPFTTSTDDAKKLIEISRVNNKVLMVDHTFLYSGAVQKIKDLIKSGELGQLKYFDSTRINLGLIQSDVNVLWDLAPHDLSILSYICEEKPISVIATGVSHTNNDIENIAYMTINY